MNCFESGYPSINLFGHGEHETGLYKNQLGAIGAAIAHFTVHHEPALISMPTGTGKTAVMILLSYVFKAKKVLVITPSQLVRKQIAGQFKEAKLLIRNNIIKREFLPNIYELKTEETSRNVWDEILLNNDVCVAIPGTLNKIIQLDSVIQVNAFDFIFVDEAHHSRAPSWTNILNYFNDARQILLTATPFRRDKKDIKARMIFNYPLKQAYEDGLFSRINFIPVNREREMTEEQINIAIAKTTEVTYRARAYHAHKIIIRTDSKARATELEKIYKNNTLLKLVLIHSGLTDKFIDKRIEELTQGHVDGIICVDMMGEGYDYPSLKIAAIHVPHKSLAITLQFVGRIARTNIEEGRVATVIASQQDFLIESIQLFREDADWSVILPDLHGAKIQQTQQEQEFSDSFESTELGQDDFILGTEPLELHLDNFLPFFHVKIYRIFSGRGAGHRIGADPLIERLVDITKTLDLDGLSVLDNPVLRYTSVSEEQQVSIYVVSQVSTPPWILDSQELFNINNELIVVHYNEDNSLLFICSTIKENELYERIATNLTEAESVYEMVALPHLKRTMAGWQNEKMYNLGMRSRKTKGNDESYKQILGPLVQKGILPSDKFSYTRGHSFGGAFDSVLQNNVLLGISTSSKVWSLDEKKIIYFISWCQGLARKIGDPEMDNLAGPLTDLDAGAIIEVMPNGQVFFADWHEDIYARAMKILFVDEDGILSDEFLLCSCDIKMDEIIDNQMRLTISKDINQCNVLFSISPFISYTYVENSTSKIIIRQGNSTKDPEYFLSLLREAPINIYYEDLSLLSGKVKFESTLDITRFSPENMIKAIWPGTVNVQREFLNHEELEQRAAGHPISLSIHEYILELAIAEFESVYYDHGSLEIADIIGFKPGLVRFYHCKKQNSDQPRCSVDDLYEVIGQAVKSVHWSNRKLMLMQLIKRAEKNNIQAKIKKGSIPAINSVLNAFGNPSIPVEIIIVQPGLKSDGHSNTQAEAFNRISTLLSGAEEYLAAVSNCKLKVICS